MVKIHLLFVQVIIYPYVSSNKKMEGIMTPSI